MEYKKRCRTCGKVYCYTDEDLKKNTQNSAMATVSALGGLASIFGGTIFHTAHLNNQTQKYNDKIVDYTKCPYCNSRDIASISNEEYTKITNEIGVGSSKKIEVNANATPESLIKRAELFLEDGEWDYADAYADACLDIEPENTYAYVCKLLAELKIKKMDYLVKCNTPFGDSNNFKKALRFADNELKATLIEHLEKAKKNQRVMQFDSIYHNAKKKMVGEEISNYESAIKLFQTIANWKDANSQIEICQQIISEINERRIQEKIEQERIADEKRRENEKKSKKIKKKLLFAIPILCVVVAFLCVLNSVIIPNVKYNSAINLMNNRNYVQAYEKFIEINGYKDSSEQAKSIYAKFEIEKMLNEQVGSYVNFGSYDQDDDLENGKEEIEWILLEKQKDKALLISRYALDCKPYNEILVDTTWEQCTLRKWLNNTFFTSAFTENEQEMIITSPVLADNNPEHDTVHPGNQTDDKVFLLSIKEFNKYFTTINASCSPTKYAISNKVWESDYGYTWWWLRTPGEFQNHASGVSALGKIDQEGHYVKLVDKAVRPVIWVRFDIVN